MIPARRPLSALAAILAVVAAACTSGAGARDAAPTDAPPPPKASALQSVACGLPHVQLLREWRGYYPGRSPDIIMLPHPPDYMGAGYPHVGPWNYLENVPLALYGPGYVRNAGQLGRDVTLADWAPTTAALLHFDHQFPDGRVLSDALVPAAKRVVPPRVIVTVVWDGSGWDVLNQWPDSWPNLKSLMSRGTSYRKATVGSAPTSTAQDHPMLGTGAFPNRHGIVGNHVRVGSHIQFPFANGPNLLMLPTVADMYDKANGNLPKIGMVASSPWHLGMIGHGNYLDGADADIVSLHQFGGPDWSLPAPLDQFYEFPTYLNSLPGLSTYAHYADAIDGHVDGKWRGLEISKQGAGFNTPERIPYQTAAIEEVIKREGFGQDELPDLFFTNYKLIDEVSHIWTMNSLEMRDSVVASDQALPELIRFLNEQVGKGRWVMAVTADHGDMPNPEVTRAFRGSTAALKGYVNRVFDHDSDQVPVLQNLQPTHIFVNVEELEQNGFTLGQLSEYIAGLTKSQLAASDSIIQPGEENDRVFDAVFPSNIMKTLPCLPEARSSQ
ncbi:MAG: alkaline phosphatase family protein [Actinomycetota bacterium]